MITGAKWVDNIVEPHGPCTFPTPNDMPNRWLRKAKELVDRVHAFDTKIFLQLTAGLGRSALPSIVDKENFVAPSPVMNRWIDEPCRELTTEEVETIVKEFGQAAKLAKMAGFDGIEVHAVHEGYLLDCFTMKFFNQRPDKYGGDLKGRLTFPIEVYEACRDAVGPDFPIGLRFSVKSYIKDYRKGIVPGEADTVEEKGRDIPEALEAAQILQDTGYQFFDADAGSYDAWYWAHPPMYFHKGVYLDLMRELKKVSKVPLLVCGREFYVSIHKAEVKKKVVVVGGGPAGLEAARVSALRGHDVTLIEATNRLGGALKIGSVPDFKFDDRHLIKYYETQLDELGVDVMLNTKADKALIDSLKPDLLYLAEGTTPIVPKIPGVEKAVLAQDVLAGKAEADDAPVIVGGGLVGCELALHLAQHGKQPTIVEGLPDILSTGSKMAPPNEAMLRELLDFHKVKEITSSMLKEITEDGLIIETDGERKELKAKQVILAIGYKPKHPLFDKLELDYPQIYRLGDARGGGNILHAIWDGYEVARNL